jgi:hypothetical protein
MRKYSEFIVVAAALVALAAPSAALAGGNSDAAPKAAPASNGAPGRYRVRYDRLDRKGKMSLRRAGRMRHLHIGTAHAGTRVLALADQTRVTVVELETGLVLSTHQIDPTRGYWRNQHKEPGRWPSSPT